jgi:hypothetical protein
MSQPAAGGPGRPPSFFRRNVVDLVLASLVVVVAAATLFFSLVAGRLDDSTTTLTRMDPAAPEGTAVPEPTETAAASGPAVVAELEGEGDDVTDMFEVSDGWELRWETSGGERFQIELFTDEEESLGIVVDQEGDGVGSVQPPSGGHYFVDITADGSWAIVVFDAGR